MDTNPFLTADVPDPTDFPPPTEAPGFRTLDGALRCPICGEVYDAPVSISCGHTFCSTCIRSALGIKQECPQCRKTANEVHIRVNHTIENVISSWKEARPFVLNLIQNEAKRKAEEQAETERNASRKRRRTVRSTSVELVEAGPSYSSSVRPASPVKSKSSTNNKPKSTTWGGKDVHVIPSSDVEEDEDLSSTARSASMVPGESTIVQCPLCQASLKYRHLNQHMDSGCVSFKNNATTSSRNGTATAKKEKEAWSNIFAGGGGGTGKGKTKKKPSERDKQDEDDPLPMATYATLKDRQLKDMLLEQGLPVGGDRGVWEERHKRWVMIYNANLDRSTTNRKKKSELLRELKKWEDEHARKKKVVVGDVVAYQKEHKSEFSRLVEAARQSRPKSSPRLQDLGLASSNDPSPVSSKDLQLLTIQRTESECMMQPPSSSQLTEIVQSSQL
ncbi:hypothetical protein BJ165DRAFT_1418665 [Panaeolus papilionaceus]|nr:hypothetical protein BJ165DRAFT_1418665 [Panaeolus papilionaceus]